MLSYWADMDIHTNPFELDLDRFVDLDMEAEFIGKAALRRIKTEGVNRKLVGLEISGQPLAGPNTRFWPLYAGDDPVGMVTADCAPVGTELRLLEPDGVIAKVVDKPFIKPPEQLTQVFTRDQS